MLQILLWHHHIKFGELSETRPALSQRSNPHCWRQVFHTKIIQGKLAAIALAQVGLEDFTIQAQDRWSSVAFLTYIQTSRDQLAQSSQAIARPHTGLLQKTCIT